MNELTPEEWLLVAEDLEKSIHPDKLKRMVGASSIDRGSALVDHTRHLDCYPGSMIDEVREYRDNVLKSPHPFRSVAGKRQMDGVTQKMILQVGDAPLFGVKEPVKYMLKPYHEKVPKWFARSYGRLPILGWAEMATQDLFHAAGLGDVHHKVHTSEHDLGPGIGKSPLLVVHLTPHMVSIDHAQYSYSPSYGNARTARKIGILDFLTNNLDRHAGNLMVNPNERKLLAIDHGRNFQYCNTHATKWQNMSHHRALVDSIGPYIGGRTTALKLIENPMKMNGYQKIDAYEDIIEDWWSDHSDQIADAFDRNIAQIKDPQVRDHISRNFYARKQMLDQMAEFGLDNFGEDWHNTAVPLYVLGHNHGAFQRGDYR